MIASINRYRKFIAAAITSGLAACATFGFVVSDGTTAAHVLQIVFLALNAPLVYQVANK